MTDLQIYRRSACEFAFQQRINAHVVKNVLVFFSREKFPVERFTAHSEPLLDKAEVIEGGTLDMTDNPKYCVFARFCHPEGDAWSLTEQSSAPEARRMAIREASMCPGGRLTAWDKSSGKPFEFRFEPSLGLIEDVTIGSSGGLWIRGGIALRRETGKTYEIRNRVVVCRCGQSANKPYCDGTHAAIKWRDNLEGEPVGETLPEEVY